MLLYMFIISNTFLANWRQPDPVPNLGDRNTVLFIPIQMIRMTAIMMLTPGLIVMKTKTPGVIRIKARAVALIIMGQILVEVSPISHMEAMQGLLILTWMNLLVLLPSPNTSATCHSSRHSEMPL